MSLNNKIKTPKGGLSPNVTPKNSRRSPSPAAPGKRGCSPSWRNNGVNGAPPDKYVCELDEKSLKKTEEELKEKPEERESHVTALREWVLSQSHFRCPTDTRYLLAFLRVRYFSQLDSRQLIEKFLCRRTRFPEWFRDLDTCDPKFLSALDDGFFLLLPGRDSDGRRIFIFRPGQIDLSSDAYSKADIFRAFACIIDYLYLVDEMTSVNGTVSISDMGGVTFKHVTQISGDERKDFLQSWQGSYPARVKQIHIYNTGPVAEMILQIMRFCMSEKIQNRGRHDSYLRQEWHLELKKIYHKDDLTLKIHGQLLTNLYKEVPMELLPMEYLPEDYKGQCAGPVKDIIGLMKAELTRPEVRERLLYLSSDQFGYDESSAPVTSSLMSSLTSSAAARSIVGVAGAIQESFRKLNVD